MSDYVQMWKDLGMDLETHDLLCQVLPTAVGEVKIVKGVDEELLKTALKGVL